MIAGTKVRLRLKKLEDAHLDYRWHTDTELSDLDAVTPLRMAYEDFVEEYREQLRHPSAIRRSFAIETLDGRHIGNCVYYNIDRIHREAEVGIMIGEKEFWGRGYGCDAMTALADFIFRHSNFGRLYLKTLEKNLRAQSSFRKCGFIACGRMVRDGYEFMLMELTRRSWRELYDQRKMDKAAESP